MSDSGGSDDGSTKSVGEDDNIQVKTLISSTGGDLRRTSFILSAIQIAMAQFDITSKSIFQGGEKFCLIFSKMYICNFYKFDDAFTFIEWIDKKMCGDYFYKSRFLWFDPSDNSFHWSKETDRKIPHKRLRLDGRISHVKRDLNFVTQAKEYGLTVTFINGETLCMKV